MRYFKQFHILVHSKTRLSTKHEITEEAKALEETLWYSSEEHYEDAKWWINIHFFLGIPSAVFSAIAGASALAQFDYHNIIAGVLAIIVAVLAALSTFLNPSARANTHQISGDKLNALRYAVRIFYNIDVPLAISELDLAKQLKEFFKQRDELNLSSPPLSERAYKKAKNTIEKQKMQEK